MWAHQPFVNQPKQGFNLMLWPRLELICRWRGDGAVWLALWELEGWRLVVDRGGVCVLGGVLLRSSTYTAAHRQGENCVIWPHDSTHTLSYIQYIHTHLHHSFRCLHLLFTLVLKKTKNISRSNVRSTTVPTPCTHISYNVHVCRRKHRLSPTPSFHHCRLSSD